VVRAKIVRIGNSRGIRIPKAVLDECGIEDSVELKVDDGAITLRAVESPRAGWAEAALTMAAAGEDRLIDPPTTTRFEETDWEW
jgi:antitoxin MazE